MQQQAIFTERSTRRSVSEWGAEVKKRLIDRRMQQDDLVRTLRSRGYDIDKAALCNLLYGIGISNRRGEIEEISRILEIPYQSGVGA